MFGSEWMIDLRSAIRLRLTKATTATRVPQLATYLRRQPTRHHRSPLLPPLQPHPSPMRLDDLVAEREADAGAAGFGRVEREQGLAHHVVGHARARVAHAHDRAVG